MKHNPIIFILLLSLITFQPVTTPKANAAIITGSLLYLGGKVIAAYKAARVAKAARMALLAARAAKSVRTARSMGKGATFIKAATIRAAAAQKAANLARFKAQKAGVEVALRNLGKYITDAKQKYPDLRSQTINKHLQGADAAIRRGNLIFNHNNPRFASAFQHLFIVLQAEPTNPQAITTLSQIAATYQDWAKRAMASGDYDEADKNLRISKALIDAYRFKYRYREQRNLTNQLAAIIQPEGSKHCTVNDYLHKRSARGDFKAVVDCLDAGIVVDLRETRSRHNWTALHSAAANGKLAVAKELVRRGADINATDYYGRTALDHAIYKKHQNTERLLRSLGAARRQHS